MRPVLVLLLLAQAALAARTASISGTVIDSGSRVPIVAARVELRVSSSMDTLATAISDSTGSFRFEVQVAGNYVIEAAAETYLGTRDHPGQGVIQFDESDFADGKPPVERTTAVAITRAAILSGSLKDGASQQPLEGFGVKALAITWIRGKRELHEQGLATSNKDGVFRVEVPAGDYFLLISPSRSAPQKIAVGREPDYSAKFMRTRGYPATYWPRGDLSASTPFTVVGGIENNAGAIDISEIALGRIRGSVPASQCDDDERINLSFEMLPYKDNALRGSVQGPCGTSFTVANLAPGRYRISAMTLPTNRFAAARDPSKSMSQIEAELRDAAMFMMSRNTSAEVSVVEGSDEDTVLDYESTFEVEAKLQCDCSQTMKRSVMVPRIVLGEIQFTLVELPEGAPPEMQNDATRMRLPRRPARVKAANLPAGFALKEVLSNGVATGGVFVPSAVARQSMTIVLTDKPARVSASVVHDDKPVPGVHIIAGRWPIEHIDNFPNYETAACDSQGQCAIDRLSPTTWSVIAVSADSWDKLELPGVLDQWLSAGEVITLLPGESRGLRFESQN
jgi:hypothetical protein